MGSMLQLNKEFPMDDLLPADKAESLIAPPSEGQASDVLQMVILQRLISDVENVQQDIPGDKDE